jgi:hypothetical protein
VPALFVPLFFPVCADFLSLFLSLSLSLFLSLSFSLSLSLFSSLSTEEDELHLSISDLDAIDDCKKAEDDRAFIEPSWSISRTLIEL